MSTELLPRPLCEISFAVLPHCMTRDCSCLQPWIFQDAQMHILELPSTLCRSIRLTVSSVHMSISGSAAEASAFWQSTALQVRGQRVLSHCKLLQCISLLAKQPAPAVLGQWAARGLCPFH